MAKFHSLKVIDIKKETADCVSVALGVPSELRSSFVFIPGQYLTFKQEIDGEEVRRSYSICSAPHEQELRVAVKQVKEGRFSTFANNVLKEGDTLQTMEPDGNFVHNGFGLSGNSYVGFAAGSGITPIMAILKTLLMCEPGSHFTLFYGNRTSDEVIFKEEIEALKNQYLDRLTVNYLFSREHLEAPLFNGRIDAEKTATFLKTLIRKETVDKFFLCGPEQMIFSVKDTLIEHEVPEEKIKFELFTSTTPTSSEEVFHGNLKEEQFEDVSQVEIVLDGNKFSFNLAYAGENVLDAALEQGADLPYACKGGVCCTCKAKLLEGEVEMALNYSLEQDEIDNGFILTCQAHPRTAKIKVDFDV